MTTPPPVPRRRRAGGPGLVNPAVFGFRGGDGYNIVGQPVTVDGKPSVFARTGGATAVDSNGVVYTAPTGVARRTVVGGESALLLEPQRTNLAIRSQEFDTWSDISSSVVTANTTIAPDGTLTADTLTATVTGSGRRRNVVFTGDGTKCVSIFLKQGTAAENTLLLRDLTASTNRQQMRVVWTAGVPALNSTGGAGTIYPVQPYANGWYRVLFSADSVVASNTNAVQVTIDPILGTGTVLAWGAQAENAVVPSSYIATEGTTVTRNADSLYFDFLTTPQELTVYARSINVGGYSASSALRRAVFIGNGASVTANPRLSCNVTGAGLLQTQYDDGTVSRSNTGASIGTAVLGDIVEHRNVVAADGSVATGGSRNNAAEVVSSLATTGPFGSAFAEPRIYLSGLSAGNDSFAFTHVCVALGTRTRAQMRALAGVPN